MDPTDRSSGEALVRRLVDELVEAHDPSTTPAAEFLGAQYDAGLAWVHFGEGFGGLGLSPALQRVVDTLLHDLGAPNGQPTNPVGYGHGAGSVHAHGTPEQKRRWLRPLFTCEELWCQLFSEPGAGSDLAGLATTAVRDGDEWVVNGQKVWSSGAMHASWAILLARTDPTVPKHRGLTFFVLDMHTPGVDVRPIREATGGAHFNETFLTDVRIPDACRLGDVGMGWSVSVTTLMYERVTIGDQRSTLMQRPIELWHSRRPGGAMCDAVLRDRLVRLWSRDRINDLMAERSRALRAAGQPGPDGSLGKLAVTRFKQAWADLCVDLLGPDGQVGVTYEPHGGRFGAEGLRSPQRELVASVSQTIQGGTSEIMLNILGERVLGLPGDVRVDKDVPWNQVPRS